MKPDWDKLSAKYEDSPTVVIADVDCTIHKDLCSKYGVRGYPTIKYFTGSTDPSGDKYEGARDLKSLEKFVDENLGPSCGPENRDLCNEEELAVLDKFLALSAEERENLIQEKSDAIENAEKTFKDAVDELTKTYEQLGKDKEAAIDAVTPDLRVLRAIAAMSKGNSHDEL